MHLLTQSALLRVLGWTLFDSLWQMSLLWAFYHLVLLVFKNLPARARHGLILLLLTTGFVWSILNFVANYLLTDPLPGSAPGVPLYELGGVWPILDDVHSLAGLVLPWCSSLYLIILITLLVHYCRQYSRTGRLAREGHFPLTPELDAFVSSTARRMGIGANVRAHLSSLVDVPVTLGFLKPVILLPMAMVTQLTIIQVEAILVHELAHIRRKDYLLNLLVTAMELIYFFNPFVRRLIGQLKKEREHCCDDTVLEYRYDPHAYVSALLSLSRQSRQIPRQIPLGVAVAATGDGGEQLLLQRARKILQQKRTDVHPGNRPLMGLVLAAFASVLTLGHSRPTRTAATPGDIPKASLTASQPAANAETVLLVINPRPLPSTIRRRPVVRHILHADRRLANRQLHDLAKAFLSEAATTQTPGSAHSGLTDGTRRDYSIDDPDDNEIGALPDQGGAIPGAPFVPSASFSFQYTDTLPPAATLAMLQELSQNALRLQILRLRAEIRLGVLMLQEQENVVRRVSVNESQVKPNNSLEIKLLRALLQQQLQIRRQYMLQLERLRRQLQETSHPLTIVNI